MAITHTEIRGSGDSRDAIDRTGTGKRTFIVRGSTSRTSIDAHVISEALLPELVTFGTRQMVYRDADVEELAYGVYQVTGNYAEPDRAEKERRLDVGEKKLSFDTSGATVRVFTSRSTIAKHPTTAGDYKGLIGVNASGEPEGVDVVIPGLKITITSRLARASVDAAFVKTLARMTGTVNDADFYGFDPKELLFLGATGDVATVTDPELTFNFLASENVTGLEFGDITGVDKKGHEYVWILYKDEKDAVASPAVLVQRPLAVYVEELYAEADWDELGIGDSL